MSDLLEIVKEIDALLKKLEQVLRTSKSKVTDEEIADITSRSVRAFGFFQDQVYKKDVVTVENNQSFVEIGIKLHNRVRNLSLTSLGVAKSLLRATAAWIFILFGEKNSKVFSIIIKLLSKSGEHLVQQEDTKDFGSICFRACLTIWNSSLDSSFYDQLPYMELQETKHCVFKCLQGIVATSAPTAMTKEEIKNMVSMGVSMVDSVDERFQLSFVEVLLKLGHQVINPRRPTEVPATERCQDAIFYLNIGMSILRKPTWSSIMNSESIKVKEGIKEAEYSSSADGTSTLIRSFLDAKVRLLLSLVYIHVDMNDIDKAVSSISMIEELEQAKFHFANESLASTVWLAKLLVALKQGDQERSELAVRSLIRLPQSAFSTALSAVKKFQEQIKDCERQTVSDLYKQLASKYSRYSDPEYTTVRISHLQSAMSQLRVGGEDDNFELKTRDIAARIASDHVHGVHTLPQDELNLFCNIILDLIAKLQDLELWKPIVGWSEILISFLNNEQECSDDMQSARNANILTSLMALKVYSYLQLNQLADAVDTAQRLVSKRANIVRNFTTLFMALIRYEDINATSVLQRWQESVALLQDSLSTEEKLRVFLINAKITSQTDLTAEKQFSLIDHLLKTWLQIFVEEEYWKHCGGEIEKVDSIDREAACSFFDVVGEYFHRCLFYTLCCGRQQLLNKNSTDSNLQQLCSLIARKAKNFQAADDSQNSNNLSTETMDLFQKLVAMGASETMGAIVPILRECVIPLLKISFCAVSKTCRTPNWQAALGGQHILLNTVNGCYSLVLAMLEQISQHRIGFESNRQLLISGMQSFVDLLKESINLLELMEGSSKKSLVQCNVLIAVCLLDLADREADNLVEVENADHGGRKVETENTIREYAKETVIFLNAATQLQEEYMDFADESDELLRSLILLLSISSISRMGSVSESERFVSGHERDFRLLNESCVRQAVEQMTSSRCFSMESCRKAIELCIQGLSQRPNITSSIPWLFRKLIELSPNRRYACDRLADVEKLLREKSGAHDDFADDVDALVAKSYNCALMLVDLDQLHLAEQFVMRSIALAEFSSEDCKQYSTRLQETLTFIKREICTSSVNARGQQDQDLADKSQVVPNESASHNIAEPNLVGHLTMEVMLPSK